MANNEHERLCLCNHPIWFHDDEPPMGKGQGCDLCGCAEYRATEPVNESAYQAAIRAAVEYARANGIPLDEAKVREAGL